MKQWFQSIDWVALGITGVVAVVAAVAYAFIVDDADMLTAIIIGLLAGVGTPLAYHTADRAISFA